MEWITGIVAAVIGALIWEIVRSGFRQFSELRGTMGGYWYQITYNPKDITQIWSIELLQIRQVGDELFGSMWRIFRGERDKNPHYDRSWRFLARLHTGFVRGTYWSESGDGGDGVMRMFQVNRSECNGGFQEEHPVHDGSGPTYVNFEALLKWVREGSDQEQTILSLVSNRGYGDLAQMHRVARRVLQKKLRRTSRKGHINESLAYAGALTDLSGPLAIGRQHLADQDNEPRS